MGLTKAERHNRMMDKVFDTHHKIEAVRKDLLPSCTDYDFYLTKAEKKFGLERNEARSRFGQFTYGQWKELLKLF